MNVEVALVDLRGPVVALADTLQIEPGVFEVLLVYLPELQDVDLGLEGNLSGRGLLVTAPFSPRMRRLTPSPAGNSTDA